MFRPVERNVLNQISLTGMRSIVLLGLLIAAPRSLKEIRKAFLELNIIEESHSDDILRIDLNTIKSIGCEISRPSPKNDFKYTLLEHPFSLKITDEDIRYFKKVYSRLKADANIRMLLDFDELIQKISNYIYDSDIKEKFIGVSAFKYYSIDSIKELLVDCKYEKTLELVYKKTKKDNEYTKEVIAQKLVFNNDQLYLHCYDKSIHKSIVLNVKRILRILSRKIENGTPDIKKFVVKFYLKDFNLENLNEDEFVIEITNNEYIVEGAYYNEFLALQRVLSFGACCTVIEPEEFKNKVIKKLKEMRNIYGT